MFLPEESQGWGSLVGCRLWGRTESDTTSDLAVTAAAAAKGSKLKLESDYQVRSKSTLKELVVFLPLGVS